MLKRYGLDHQIDKVILMKTNMMKELTVVAFKIEIIQKKSENLERKDLNIKSIVRNPKIRNKVKRKQKSKKLKRKRSLLAAIIVVTVK